MKKVKLNELYFTFNGEEEDDSKEHWKEYYLTTKDGCKEFVIKVGDEIVLGLIAITYYNDYFLNVEGEKYNKKIVSDGITLIYVNGTDDVVDVTLECGIEWIIPLNKIVNKIK